MFAYFTLIVPVLQMSRDVHIHKQKTHKRQQGGEGDRGNVTND